MAKEEVNKEATLDAFKKGSFEGMMTLKAELLVVGHPQMPDEKLNKLAVKFLYENRHSISPKRLEESLTNAPELLAMYRIEAVQGVGLEGKGRTVPPFSSVKDAVKFTLSIKELPEAKVTQHESTLQPTKARASTPRVLTEAQMNAEVAADLIIAENRAQLRQAPKVLKDPDEARLPADAMAAVAQAGKGMLAAGGTPVPGQSAPKTQLGGNANKTSTIRR